MKQITVAGAGYVGLSIACLLASESRVTLIDVMPDKVELLNQKISPIQDKDICRYLDSGSLHLKATTDAHEAYTNADIIIVAVPTNYDEKTNRFDTSSVESVIDLGTNLNPKALFVIKSTIPVGFTESIAGSFPESRIIFSPEFLREGQALHDNLYPSRIVAGFPKSGAASEDDAKSFAAMLADAALTNSVPVLTVSSTEAEAVKLFTNTYLAMRVAFFNELDTYAETNDLDSASIIDGITLDPRVGTDYCNPSFGYGGYCLPKDTKQLLAEFESIPQNIVQAVVDANDTRKKFIAHRITKLLDSQNKRDPVIGAYRLTMKLGSDNFRSSAIQDVIANLAAEGYRVIVYEPTLSTNSFNGLDVIDDFDLFSELSDIIIANRIDASLEQVSDKVYSRDCQKGF